MENLPISSSDALAKFCEIQKKSDYITVDTEFLRDQTYWPQLCLVQIAGSDQAATIDTLATDIDLAPLYDLMADRALLKVFHAGRQDIEIFFHRTGSIPEPLFDTQVAAMVCGFGDQVGYEALISKLVGAQVDKSSRFTDWSHRPLTQKQLKYALADVTHLRPAYEKLAFTLEKNGRTHWLDQEMDILMDPETYRLDPEYAWRRIKSRNKNKRFHAILRELAAWREREAQSRNIPRNRIMRDDAILEIAAQAPRSSNDLKRMRAVPKGYVNGEKSTDILEAVKRGKAVPEANLPRLEKYTPRPPRIGPVSDLLKVLLKHVTETQNVAPRLIASSEDLDRIAADDNADVPALKGWRLELFGAQALALKAGRVALTAKGNRTRIIEVSKDNEKKK